MQRSALDATLLLLLLLQLCRAPRRSAMRAHAALLLLLLAGAAAAALPPVPLSRRAMLQASPEGGAAAPGTVASPAPAPAPVPASSSSELPSLEWPLSGREWAMFVLAGLAMFVMAGAGVGEPNGSADPAATWLLHCSTALHAWLTLPLQ